MADDRLTSYANIAALEEEHTKIIKLVDDTITHIQSKQKELGGIQISLLDANTAKESTEAINKGKKSVDELTLSVREYKKLQDQLATTEAKLAVAQTDTARALAATRVELQATNKLNKDGISAYNELQTQLAAASRLYKDLAASRGLDNKATLEAQKRAVDLNNQLKAIDAGMGNYQRNVGNYSSATANLNRNIGILATELPNAGISIRTFAQSLSNNITPFIQSIKDVQAQNVQLKKDGLETTSVIKTLGQSLLSTGVITGIAVAVGLKLVDMWQKGSKAAQEAQKSIDKYNAAINSAEETERSAAQQQIARLNVLTKLAQDNAQSTRTRTLAVEELQKTYPTQFGALKQQIILEGDLTDAINEATNALLNRAAAQAAEKKFAAASENVYDLTKLKEQAIKDAQKAEEDFNKFFKLSQSSSAFAAKESTATILNSYRLRASAAKESVDKIDKDLKKSTQEQLGFLKDATDNAAKAGDALFKAQETAAEKASKKSPRIKTESEEDKKAAAAKKRSEDLAATILQQMNNVELNEQQMTEKSLDALLTSFENKKIKLKEYNQQKEQIVIESEDRILNYQIEALMDYLKAEGLQEDEIAKIQEKITQLKISQIKKINKAREAAAENVAKNEAKIEEKSEQDKIDAAKKTAELKKQLDNDIAKNRKQLEEELIRFVETAIMASYERRIRAAEDEGEKIKESGEKEIEAINNSTLSQIEKDRRIDESKAITAAKEKENERKVADIKNQAAKTEKLITIGKIIAQTALNEVSALQYLTNPITAPLYPALAGLIAGLGAAQIATVLATPLPKYAEGTSDHKGGLAILGDGKEHELVIEPNKKPYWSANTDTLYNLPKHTQVIPESKLGSAVTQPSNKDVVMAVMEMSGLIDGGLNKLNRTIRNKETVRLEAKNRRWQDYYYENAKA
jgi:hypothetical protein